MNFEFENRWYSHYEILKLLEERGAKVNYSDPYLPTFPKTRKYNFDLKSIEITKEKISIYDAVILATDHDKFDLSLVERFSTLSAGRPGWRFSKVDAFAVGFPVIRRINSSRFSLSM